ncbi:hypothetical protein BDV29DRAFT_169749 [Aspergillus leporis]|jgi:hypothetical protein|uniref:Uncharacterized protein n=1 Tax=Aspergillus leporis TaxID=41062 RepID=A0A5N5X7E5_9EURO|nr:hypothetical protein BDV29DRAFT_169749 [Aspergillus leporis]
MFLSSRTDDFAALVNINHSATTSFSVLAPTDNSSYSQLSHDMVDVSTHGTVFFPVSVTNAFRPCPSQPEAPDPESLDLGSRILQLAVHDFALYQALINRYFELSQVRVVPRTSTDILVSSLQNLIACGVFGPNERWASGAGQEGLQQYHTGNNLQLVKYAQ